MNNKKEFENSYSSELEEFNGGSWGAIAVAAGILIVGTCKLSMEVAENIGYYNGKAAPTLPHKSSHLNK